MPEDRNQKSEASDGFGPWDLLRAFHQNEAGLGVELGAFGHLVSVF
jgi:hypothetical protein